MCVCVCGGGVGVSKNQEPITATGDYILNKQGIRGCMSVALGEVQEIIH